MTSEEKCIHFCYSIIRNIPTFVVLRDKVACDANRLATNVQSINLVRLLRAHSEYPADGRLLYVLGCVVTRVCCMCSASACRRTYGAQYGRRLHGAPAGPRGRRGAAPRPRRARARAAVRTAAAHAQQVLRLPVAHRQRKYTHYVTRSRPHMALLLGHASVLLPLRS